MVVVLAGGMGAARFLRGLLRVVPSHEVTIVGNTADDIRMYGVHVSPDLDIVTFMLAGVLDEERQFGLTGDTHLVMDELAATGEDTWFALGDRDYGVCRARTGWLDGGVPLHECTARLAERFGIGARLLPMSDDLAHTVVDTDAGSMHFQEYWVRHRAQVGVRGIGMSAPTTPAPGVLDAIAEAETIVIAPSNPVVSVGPILGVDGVREALRAARAPVVGISPIIGGRVVRGMADKLLPVVGAEVSARGVARLYEDILDGWVIDEIDAAQAADIDAEVDMTATLMRTPEDAAALAKRTLALAARLR